MGRVGVAGGEGPWGELGGYEVGGEAAAEVHLRPLSGMGWLP